MDKKTYGTQKIVILRALNLGDLLVTVPSFRTLRSAFPKAEITLIGLPWAKDFVKKFSSYLDKFLEFPGFPGLPERKPDFSKIPEFIKKVQKENFDLAIQMHGDGTIVNPLVSLFNAKLTAGFALPGKPNPINSLFTHYPQNLHERDRYLKLMEFLGLKIQGGYLEFPINKEDYYSFATLKKRFGFRTNKYICIHPGSKNPKRRWDQEKFAYIANRLKRFGFDLVITGVKEEKDLSLILQEKLEFEPIDLCGKTSLGSLGVLLKQSSLVISNDTGVAHISYALGSPSITIFNDIDKTKSWGSPNPYLHSMVTPLESNNPYRVLNMALEKIFQHKFFNYQNSERNYSYEI